MSNATARRPRWGLVLLAVILATSAVAGNLTPTYAASFVVNTTADEDNTDGDCSLREALRAANDDVTVDACGVPGRGADTINLIPGTYTLSLDELSISDDLTLRGLPDTFTIIDANEASRVIAITDGSVVHIEHLTVTGGDSGIAAGSGIYVQDGSLTLTRVKVSNNRPEGGIYLLGPSTLTLAESQIIDNTGPGLYLRSGVSATVRNSQISGNTNDSAGGGIFSQGTLEVINSTISGNRTTVNGGGIHVSGGVTRFYNVTVAANTADSDATSSTSGGGVSVQGDALLQVRNSIIADNIDASVSTKAPDCTGALTSNGYNLIENPTDCAIGGDTTGNLTSIAPVLGPLQANGGPTLTHALLSGSPAIDAGNPVGCEDQNSVMLSTDQRTFVRTAHCDMGAYEYDSPGLATATPTITRTPSSTPAPTRTPTRTPTSSSTALPPPADGPPTSTPTATATTPPPPAEGPPIFTPTATPDSNTTAVPALYLPLLRR